MAHQSSWPAFLGRKRCARRDKPSSRRALWDLLVRQPNLTQPAKELTHGVQELAEGVESAGAVVPDSRPASVRRKSTRAGPPGDRVAGGPDGADRVDSIGIRRRHHLLVPGKYRRSPGQRGAYGPDHEQPHGVK